jgi:hypothetical protein
MDVIESEMTMHRVTEHCRRTHYNNRKAICEFCSHLEVSCKRCEARLPNCPDPVKSLDEYIKNNERGVPYITGDLQTKLGNIEYRRKYKEDNKDKIKEYNEINKDKIKEYWRKYREDNKDKIKEYQKEYNKSYRETNRDKKIDCDKQYREVNKDKLKEIRKIFNRY